MSHNFFVARKLWRERAKRVIQENECSLNLILSDVQFHSKDQLTNSSSNSCFFSGKLKLTTDDWQIIDPNGEFRQIQTFDRVFMKLVVKPQDYVENQLLVEQQLYRYIIDPLIENNHTHHLINFLGSSACTRLDLGLSEQKWREVLNQLNVRDKNTQLHLLILEQSVGIKTSKNEADFMSFGNPRRIQPGSWQTLSYQNLINMDLNLTGKLVQPDVIQKHVCLLFQLFYTFWCLDRQRFMDNDPHLDNVLITRLEKPHLFRYRLGPLRVIEFETDMMVQIFDFDWSSCVHVGVERSLFLDRNVQCRRRSLCNNFVQGYDTFGVLNILESIMCEPEEQPRSPEIAKWLYSIISYEDRQEINAFQKEIEKMSNKTKVQFKQHFQKHPDTVENLIEYEAKYQESKPFSLGLQNLYVPQLLQRIDHDKLTPGDIVASMVDTFPHYLPCTHKTNNNTQIVEQKLPNERLVFWERLSADDVPSHFLSRFRIKSNPTVPLTSVHMISKSWFTKQYELVSRITAEKNPNDFSSMLPTWDKELTKMNYNWKKAAMTLYMQSASLLHVTSLDPSLAYVCILMSCPMFYGCPRRYAWSLLGVQDENIDRKQAFIETDLGALWLDVWSCFNYQLPITMPYLHRMGTQPKENFELYD